MVSRTPTGVVAEHPATEQCAEWILPYQRAVLRAKVDLTMLTSASGVLATLHGGPGGRLIQVGLR